MITLILPWYGDDRIRYEDHVLEFLQRNSQAATNTAVRITLHASEARHDPSTAESFPENHDLAELARWVADEIMSLIQHPTFQDLDAAFTGVAVSFYETAQSAGARPVRGMS